MEVEEPQRNKLCRAYRAQTNCRSNHGQNRRNVFRLPCRSAKSASVARFADLNLSPHKPSPGDDPRKGATAPFLVVLRGCKGGNRNPPLPFSFYRQRLFLCRAKKKGLKRSHGSIPFNEKGLHLRCKLYSPLKRDSAACTPSSIRHSAASAACSSAVCSVG